MAFRPFSLIPAITSDSFFSDRFPQMDHFFNRFGDLPTQHMPDYNIKKIDDSHYTVTLSVPGFKEEDLSINAGQGQLIIEGKHEEKSEKETENDEYIHRGIQKRSFSLRFNLGERMKVQSADLEDGFLEIVLEEEAPKEEAFEKIAISKK
ncbi:MAG: Hsp20 family protein [Xanthomonadaceae bacterium]|nr:Hsp20 family protein [Xanthomonadaceae bacterium]